MKVAQAIKEWNRDAIVTIVSATATAITTVLSTIAAAQAKAQLRWLWIPL